MKHGTLLMLLAVLLTACGASTVDPNEGPTLAPTAAESAIEWEAESDPGAEVSAGESLTQCTEVNPHPVGQSIAEKFEVSYERVMTWFCSGHTFDEILVALQTSGMSDRSAEELLAMRQSKSWDQIWTELGIVGP
ncbi:MAG: hypothetical protein R3248_06820 [Candidatus Promineifilaceae bacterium]|nr:hypothetical protein [Candidatus Promineifilaceae bacterium]